MRESISPTTLISLAVKSSQPKATKLNVNIVANVLRRGDISPPKAFAPGTMRIHILCSAKATPWSTPQAIKVIPTPCHRPPRSIVRKRLRYVLKLPWRLPPNEMYRYSLSHVESDTCQRRQNSVMVAEWYGALKLSGRRKPSIRATPWAISE